MPAAVRELEKPWKPLAGSLPGLTRELEKEFRFGQSVIALEGQFRMGGNLKGGSSAMWVPADRTAFDAYTLWRERDGFPRRKNRRAFRRLESLLSRHGVALSNGSWPGAGRESKNFSDKRGPLYAITVEILKKLPESHLARKELKVLQLGGWGPDGAKASAYEDGTVMMYDFAINGARRTYAGLLLHELGHAQETAFGAAEREGFLKAYDPISRDQAVLGVEYLLDPNARKTYQLRVIEEFLAETYMIYASQGGRLRSFIASLGGEAREAWGFVYAAFKQAFEGMEYA